MLHVIIYCNSGLYVLEHLCLLDTMFCLNVCCFRIALWWAFGGLHANCAGLFKVCEAEDEQTHSDGEAGSQ